MSKPIASYPPHKHLSVILRRVSGISLGLGFQAAIDAVKYLSDDDKAKVVRALQAQR